MKLFVGNVTAQNHEFMYRLIAGAQKIHRQMIMAGRQIQVAGDLQPEEVNSIVDQHVKYGMLQASEIPRAKRFHGLCYSIDKPISSELLNYLRDHNHGEKDEEGRELRKLAAITSNDILETTLRENDRPEQVRQFEVTIQEDREIESDLPQLAEGLRVIRNPNPPAPSRKARRKAA